VRISTWIVRGAPIRLRWPARDQRIRHCAAARLQGLFARGSYSAPKSRERVPRELKQLMKRGTDLLVNALLKLTADLAIEDLGEWVVPEKTSRCIGPRKRPRAGQIACAAQQL
jgi:hypothetical protein